jgi:hypothetical protein
MHSPKPSTHALEPMGSSSRRPTANRLPAGFTDKSDPWAPPHKPCPPWKPASRPQTGPTLRSDLCPPSTPSTRERRSKSPARRPRRAPWPIETSPGSRVTEEARTVPTKARTTGLPEPRCGRLRLPHLRPQPPTPGSHAAPGPFPLHIPSGPATVATSSQREIAYVFRRGLLPRALGSSIRRHT